MHAGALVRQHEGNKNGTLVKILKTNTSQSNHVLKRQLKNTALRRGWLWTLGGIITKFRRQKKKERKASWEVVVKALSFRDLSRKITARQATIRLPSGSHNQVLKVEILKGDNKPLVTTPPGETRPSVPSRILDESI